MRSIPNILVDGLAVGGLDLSEMHSIDKDAGLALTPAANSTPAIRAFHFERVGKHDPCQKVR